MSGMFATANPDALCSVLEGDGWWIPVEEPAMAKLFLRAVQKARVLEEKGLLLFETFTDIGAVDANGIRWCTGRIGWDSLQIRAIEGDRIVGTCWDGPSNGDLEFAVDLTNGRVSGGSPHFRR